MNGTVFDIQHYAVHDGPGIRTLVFLKGCPLRCAWCCNPESQLPNPQLRYIAAHCKLCLACVDHCPSRSLSVGDVSISHSFDTCNSCVQRVCLDRCNYGALNLSGKVMTSFEVMALIVRDIPFYRNSGGGVTFSGGEPLSQPDFLLDLLQQCKAAGIHTAIETCGWADPKVVQRILPFSDLFLYDLKIIDPDNHLAYTGRPVARILENLAFIASEHENIIVRVPLVGGVTDTLSNLEAISEIMAANSLKRICLEPYHTLGSGKYPELGMEYRLQQIEDYRPSQAETVREFFRMKGFDCEIA